MTPQRGECDVVVVGGGSAGAVAAATLAASGRSVVLLEAGDSDTRSCDLLDATRLPIGAGSTRVDTFDAQLTTESQTPTTVVRGRVLGGSGAVNGGYFRRAARVDFDSWPTETWSWPIVSDYYRAVEDRVPISCETESIVGRTFADACVREGVPLTSDDTDSDGCRAVRSNVAEGRRTSMANCFLEPSTSVNVRTNSRVARVILHGRRAVGVEGMDKNGAFTVRATSVVLTAGAIWTPMILMHSGIGHDETLRGIGLDVRVSLPGVGSGLRDHPEILVPYTLPLHKTSDHRSRILDVVLQIGDVEIRPYTTSFDDMISELPPTGLAMGVGLMRPDSDGFVVPLSANPFASPRIHYRYLASQHDRERFDTGIAMARRLMSVSGSMTAAPGTSMATHLGTSLHSCSTARMGVDDASVVDDRCAVHGTQNLYVMDSSMFPDVPSRGPHETVAMAAMRAADLLLGADRPDRHR
ncbi:mycofactocin system GMC family oxidoreductase MftG [Rhodococcus fascians]|nr:mycofactocin system GMC family oxidoreductase MftG [Rhodococcus fascians]MBY3995240.1 mycofactocin system GMC family oxidoreductase MftG [Rhodococcus fascians]MBY4000440.1 mycofactocin system GMC family oxidoreductase MftG [Rhodococcus fascians]MBY4005468.1 mycofactocin system GMC family oxidoreductase MftG [Rhodococcus fascians]MBY4016301.1 mycofactocin system GMC family oxidoreductase MftG [Rhodococcus fascians]